MPTEASPVTGTHPSECPKAYCHHKWHWSRCGQPMEYRGAAWNCACESSVSPRPPEPETPSAEKPGALEEAGAKHVDFYCPANQARISALEVALRASEAEVREANEALMLAEGPSTLKELAAGFIERAARIVELEAEVESLSKERDARPSWGRVAEMVESARQEGARIEREMLTADILAALRGGSPQSSHTETLVTCVSCTRGEKRIQHPDGTWGHEVWMGQEKRYSMMRPCCAPPEPPAEPRSLHDGKDYDAYDINTGKKK
jgi:hypothetical protein